MFERTLKEMTASIHIENGAFRIFTASNVGLGDLELLQGENRLDYQRALFLVHTVDSRWVSFPKMYLKKIRSFRNGIVAAFGPDMVEVVGFRN